MGLGIWGKELVDMLLLRFEVGVEIIGVYILSRLFNSESIWKCIYK